MRRILFAILLCAPLFLSAQKIGVVDFNAIFDIMPEKADAEKLLQGLSNQYQSEYALLQDEFNKKYADYQRVANDATIGEAIKERRMQEIQENNRKIDNFMTGVSADLKAKEVELMAPIKQRIHDAINAVATEDGFSIIMYKDHAAFIGFDVVDVTPSVKTHLGLQ